MSRQLVRTLLLKYFWRLARFACWSHDFQLYLLDAATLRFWEEDSLDKLWVEAAAPWDPQSVLPFSPVWGSATIGMVGAGLLIAALQSMVRYWMPNTPHVLESFTSLSRAHCDHKV